MVVCEVNGVPGDVLSHVLLLLQLEDVVYKELLEVLIGNVNAELLKTAREQHGDAPFSLSLASQHVAITEHYLIFYNRGVQDTACRAPRGARNVGAE